MERRGGERKKGEEERRGGERGDERSGGERREEEERKRGGEQRSFVQSFISQLLETDSWKNQDGDNI